MVGPLPGRGAPETPAEPTREPEPQRGDGPNVQIALGPKMTELLRRVPLDDEAEEQIGAVIGNPALDDIRKQVVSVALMNCLDRRLAELEAAADQMRSLRAEVEAFGKR